MQFDSEKPDKITRGACACNDDKVIFENAFRALREVYAGLAARTLSGKQVLTFG
jgi:hypothetical protein